jgi:hypothetical protein
MAAISGRTVLMHDLAPQIKIPHFLAPITDAELRERFQARPEIQLPGFFNTFG